MAEMLHLNNTDVNIVCGITSCRKLQQHNPDSWKQQPIQVNVLLKSQLMMLLLKVIPCDTKCMVTFK